MELKDVLSEYDIGEIKKITEPFRITNPKNKLYKVDTVNESYVLKFIGNRNREDLDNEIRAILFFQKNELLPEDYLLLTKKRSVGYKTEEGAFILLRYIQSPVSGLYKKELSNEDITKIACEIAAVHGKITEMKLKYEKDAFLEKINELKYLMEKFQTPDFAREAFSKEADGFTNIHKFMQKIPIHGDIRLCNILKEGERIYFIDFERTKIANRIFELHKIALEICLESKGFSYEKLKILLKLN